MTKKGKSQAPPADAAAEPKKLSNHAQRSLDEKKKGMYPSLVLLAHLGRSLNPKLLQRLRSTLSLSLSSPLVVCMLPSLADLGNPVVPMATSWRAKSWRYVLSSYSSTFVNMCPVVLSPENQDREAETCSRLKSPFLLALDIPLRWVNAVPWWRWGAINKDPHFRVIAFIKIMHPLLLMFAAIYSFAISR